MSYNKAMEFRWSLGVLVFVSCLPFHSADINDGIVVADETCINMLKDFANSSAAFTYCAISNARPINICQKCITTYLDVVVVYNDITKLESTEGHKCEYELANLDRLQVFNKGYDYIKNLWKNAYCDNCFVKDPATGDPTTQVTDLVKKILNASSIHQDCIKKYHIDTLRPDLVVCEKCADSYQRVNDIYDQQKGSVEFCMDIIDMMNNTRNQWSDDIGCCNDRRQPEMTMLLAASGIGVLPFIFYLMTYCLTPKKMHPVIEKKRWNADNNGQPDPPQIQVTPPTNT